MATWVDLYNRDEPLVPKPGVTALVVGSTSQLVLDRFALWSKRYGYTSYGVTVPSHDSSLLQATILVEPTEEELDSYVSGWTNSMTTFVVLPSDSKSKAFQFIKKKAQSSKLYFTVSPPSSESAVEKMESFFMMRWGVNRSAAARVCASLSHDPNELYMFDRLFVLATGGSMLPSTKADDLMSQLLRKDTHASVVSDILSGVVVAGDYTADFTRGVLTQLGHVLGSAISVGTAMLYGNSSYKDISKFTSLSLFEVSTVHSLALHHSLDRLQYLYGLVTYGMRNVDNREVLEVISRAAAR